MSSRFKKKTGKAETKVSMTDSASGSSVMHGEADDRFEPSGRLRYALRLHCYESSPIDYWMGSMTRNEVMKHVIEHPEDGGPGGFASACYTIGDIAQFFHQSQQAFKSLGWEGDGADGARFFWIPGDGCFEIGVAIKQANNGTTYIACKAPLSLPCVSNETVWEWSPPSPQPAKTESTDKALAADTLREIASLCERRARQVEVGNTAEATTESGDAYARAVSEMAAEKAGLGSVMKRGRLRSFADGIATVALPSAFDRDLALRSLVDIEAALSRAIGRDAAVDIVVEDVAGKP